MSRENGAKFAQSDTLVGLIMAGATDFLLN